MRDNRGAIGLFMLPCPRRSCSCCRGGRSATRSKPGTRAYRRFSIYPVCVGGRVLLVSALATG